jgi:general secretion pathway protein D
LNNKGNIVKPFPLLVALLGLSSALSAAPPGAGPTNNAADDAARRLLDAQYAAEGSKGATPSNSPAAARPLPAALNGATPLATPTPATPTGSAQPVVVAAAGAVSPAATNAVTNVPTPPIVRPAATNTISVGPTNRPVRTFPAIPGPGATNATVRTTATNTVAVPVVPTAGQPPPGTPPGPGQVAPAGAGAATAPAAPPDPNEILPAGMIKFQDSDIAQVLEIYQELTGRTVLKPNSLPATKISLRTQTPLTRAEAVHALDSILSLNQVSMVPQGEKFVKALAAADGGTAGQIFFKGNSTNLPEAGVYVTHMVKLKNAQPNDLVPVLQPFSKAPNSILTVPSTSMLILRDYSENIKRMVEIIEEIDVVPKQEFESVVIPIKYALAADIVQVLGSLTSGGSTTTVGSQSGASRGLSGGGGLSSGGFGNRGTGGMPGQPGYSPNQGFGQQQSGLANTAGGANRSSFQQRLQNIVNRASSSGQEDIFVLGQTKIIADERINALLIFASKSDLVTISNIIKQIDVVLPQVLIEAVVMEVNLNNNLQYGFSYIQREPSHVADWFTGIGAIRTIPFLRVGEFGSNSVGDGFTYAARIFDLDAAVTAVAGDGRGKILQRPRIQTSHAREANLFVGQSRPYPTTSYYGGGAFGGYSSIQQLQIGVTLSVLPLVNADGLVVMEIRQKVESYDGDVSIQNVGDVPITSQKEANAYVAVRDGETIMLGGFISNEKTKSHGGVPILKDIPLLGVLFRSNKESDSRRELMVMIRPTVLPTPESAATFAAEERSRMPGTKEAEQDFNRSEQKLLEDTNRRMERNSKKGSN